MKYILNLKKISKITLAGFGFLFVFASFIVIFLLNDTEGVGTYEEYLQATKEPYQNLYENLQSSLEQPKNEAIYEIYDQFEEDIGNIKISSDAEKIVRENYRQLSNLAEMCRIDYEKSQYKYSTLYGQASNVEMVLDYIEKNQSID